MANPPAPLVVAVVALPPPVNGQTLVNARVVEDLIGAGARQCVVDTSPRGHRRGLRYHLRRIAVIATVPFALAGNLGARERRLYTVVEPGNGMAYNVLVIGLARLFGYELFLHHHASSYTKRHDRRFRALSVLAGRSAVHIALSEAMAADLRGLYRFCARTVIAGNACRVPDPGALAADGKIARPRTRARIGFLSNLSPEKGLDTVLAAFAAIQAARIEATLVLAGPVVDKRAEALLQQARAQFGEAMVELGSVSGEAKAAFFRSVDVFFFPSRYRYEAQPLVVLEALSYGLPALVARHGYGGELVDPLGTATKPAMFVSFARDYLRSFVDEPGFANAQREAARARFVQLVDKSQKENSALVARMTERSMGRWPFASCPKI